MRHPVHARRRSVGQLLFVSAPVAAIHVLSLALVAAVWLVVGWQLQIERNRFQADAEAELSNMTLLFEQNIIRTASELDRILQFLRTSRDRLGAGVSWPQLVQENFTINEQAVQIAVIDADGVMITSSAMPYPPKPVDLSDREHFLFHKNSSTDVLHISRPLVGRASGKWSIQFTRRLADADGTFAGVVVISLDPSHLARSLSDLKLGRQGGVAIVGTDRIVRAGLGRYADALGSRLPDAPPAAPARARRTLAHVPAGLPPLLISSRPIAGYPLEVVAAAEGIDGNPLWQSTKRSYRIWAAGFTVFVLAAMLTGVIGLRRHEASLLRMARVDPLTGLANRAAFQEVLGDVLSPQCARVALLIVDLDDFKVVNDTHGHLVGDAVLETVGARIREAVRRGDTVARLGGDEFAVIISDLDDPGRAERVADRICACLAEPVLIEGHQMVVGASIGIAIAPEDADTPSAFFHAADVALYAAKSAGGRVFRRFAPAMVRQALQRQKLQADLAVAVEQGQLELHYQPILRVAERRVVGFEALVRWRHPRHGLIPPGQFIPMAEETGLVSAIGAWVLRQAATDAVSWPDDVKVAVNVSARQLAREDFFATVIGALHATGLPAWRLELEITETAMMEKEGSHAELLQQIQALGVAIAIDDFGTGYSSLSYVHRFPIDSIKIDRSFLVALEAEHSSISIIKAIIALADALGLRTVAEGVETEAQLEMLARLGCTEVQGYLIGRPAPVREALAVLRERGAASPAPGRGSLAPLESNAA